MRGRFLPYEQAAEMDDALRRIEVDLLGGIGATPAHQAEHRTATEEQRRRLSAALSAYTSHRARASQLDVQALLDSYETADSQSTKETALRELHKHVPHLGALAVTIWRRAPAG